MPTAITNKLTPRLLAAFAVVVLGTVLSATFFQTCLSFQPLASNFLSSDSWLALTRGVPRGPNPLSVNVPFSLTFLPLLVISFLSWFAGAAGIARIRGMTWSDALVAWGWYGWMWWSVVDVWDWIWTAASAADLQSGVRLLANTPQFWFAGCLACWITTFLTVGCSADFATKRESHRFSIGWLWLVCGLYIVVFTTMNWRLYFNLYVPHGDSAMYEEHLWNLLHGKGFRSYLDQGLFLGEHIQFVHLFLLPLYLLWPSHLLLEACSSIALALGAFPVYWMVRRQTGSQRTAIACAVAYLLYVPMQMLDIEIDLKTFRPESFGIPLLLLTLDQLDRRNLVGILVGIGFCLTVKEDYSIIFGPLGVWIALSRFTPTPKLELKNPLSRVRFTRIFGLGISLFSVFYLWLATRVIMPWFRSGVEVHYASYFDRFGKTPEQILHTMITQPGLVFDSLFKIDTALYAISLLAPLAFLPLLAPGRLAVGLPLFGILCLNQLEGSRTPHHQFHAPLVAISFWSLAAAIPRAAALAETVTNRFRWASIGARPGIDLRIRNLIWTSSLTTGLFFSLSPLGVLFWDPHSSWNWRHLYGLTDRAAVFERIATLIPMTARVASTDFVHPRYTHFERSYDYSEYHRKVSGEGNRIPDDTDYIVIDTDHHYSKIHAPSEVPELREQPDRWELVPTKTEGYFIVLKRKTSPQIESEH